MRVFKEQDYNTGELNWNTFERKHIVKVLKMCRGKKRIAALIMNINERTLYNKLIQHSIKKKEYIN